MFRTTEVDEEWIWAVAESVTATLGTKLAPLPTSTSAYPGEYLLFRLLPLSSRLIPSCFARSLFNFVFSFYCFFVSSREPSSQFLLSS